MYSFFGCFVLQIFSTTWHTIHIARYKLRKWTFLKNLHLNYFFYTCGFMNFFTAFIWVGVSKNKKVFENIYEITSHICRKTLHNSFDLSLWNTHHMLVNQHMIRPISLGYPMESISSDLFLIYTIRSQSAKKIELLEGLLINGVEYFLVTYLSF